ncbi:hypothetical protein MBLNU457_g0035t2 [Dothideomycetes sp. NU457]
MLVQGDVFQKIIEEIVQASQADFEENGVNQQTLIELQQTWQQKLSSRNVAQMPWDPKPPPPAPQPTHQPTPSSQSAPSSQNYPQQQQQQMPHNGQTQIKSEPGTEGYNGGSMPAQAYPPTAMNPAIATQRAAALMQQQFGSSANASLNAMQQARGLSLPGQQQKAPGGLQLPGQSQQSVNHQQQYAQQMQQQMASQQPRIKTEGFKTEGGQQDQKPYQQQGNGLSYAQNDGAGDAMDDWKSFIAETRSLSQEQVARNDRLVSEQVAQGSRNLESGLMMPLSQQRKPSMQRGARGRRTAPTTDGSVPLATIAQYDGEDDDDEDDKDGVKDEDAINSDLDDDEDDVANADEEDDDIDSMLCTYDKVQRVKNKWKCTLKDGVLSANGKEYLFHKATGEFEW